GCGRDEEPGAPRSAGRLPRLQWDRRQDALLDRDPQAGRLPLGQGRPHGRRGTKRRAQCRLVRQPADVPRTDRSGGRLRHRQSPRMGQGREVMAYRVIVVGMGKRGLHHATAFAANPRFELSGICSRDPQRLSAAASKLGTVRTSTVALELASEVKPHVSCFCTPPDVRLPLVELGIRSGAKLIAFEKPVAMSSSEGLAIRQPLDGAGVKAVVSHQHRYGEHYTRVKEIIASGAIGQVRTVYGTSTGWAAHMLSHLVEYTSWFNDYEPAEWAMGQAAGRGKLSDGHTSPDYVTGVVHFRNGVRGTYDCGAGAPDVSEGPYVGRKGRIGDPGSAGVRA